MPGEIHEVSAAIGRLEGSVQSLERRGYEAKAQHDAMDEKLDDVRIRMANVERLLAPIVEQHRDVVAGVADYRSVKKAGIWIGSLFAGGISAAVASAWKHFVG